ncbi:MAG: hypothetical protein B7Z83_08995, partial [Thiomonas sp. 20-64-5]
MSRRQKLRQTTGGSKPVRPPRWRPDLNQLASTEPGAVQEFCALVGSVIVDEDGVYDPRSVNDRLLLGMKGTMSEMELSLLRQRSVEALKLKAARGDLHTTVA